MTDKFISAKGSILLFGEESIYGTPVVPNRALGIVQSWSIDEKKGVEVKYGHGSSTAKAIGSTDYDVTGSFSVVLQRLEILEYMIGAPTDTAQPDSLYKHAFTAVKESVKSITLGIGLYDTNTSTMLIRSRISGIRIKKFEIVCSENNSVVVNVDWEGINNTHDDTLISYVTPIDDIYGAKDWKFLISDAGGTPAHRKTVTNVTLNMTRDIAKATGNGQQNPIYKDVDRFSLKINGSEFFTDKTIYEDWQNSASGVGIGQKDKKITILLTNGKSGKAKRELSLTLDKCKKTDGFKITSPSTTSFVKVSFAYEGFIDELYSIDEVADWNA